MIDPHQPYLSLQEDLLVSLIVGEFEMRYFLSSGFCWYQEAKHRQLTSSLLYGFNDFCTVLISVIKPLRYCIVVCTQNNCTGRQLGFVNQYLLSWSIVTLFHVQM